MGAESNASKAQSRSYFDLIGRPKPWGTPAIIAIAVLTAVGLFFRLADLSAEGFADDEVHKWLAANRYLSFDIVGDDIEHPMLMKWLIAACLIIGKKLAWEPETIVRLPNVLAGAVSIVVAAQLGRRLFGRVAGIIAAAIVSLSTTMIGYQRVGKEDTLLGLFLMLVLLCAAHAKAAADDGRPRDQNRWEWLTAVSLGLMCASKYFVWLALIPVLAYAWVRRRDLGTQWHIPIKRWFALIGGALLVFGAVNWTPFMPSHWAFGVSYMAEQQTIHGSLWFMGAIHNNLPSYHFTGTPPWFYFVFTAVKLAPPTVIAASIGLYFAIRERKPAHVIVLSWLVIWFLFHSVSGAKWGRFFQVVLPAFALLAGDATSRALRWFAQMRARGAVPAARFANAAFAAALVVPLVATEAWASATHAPHYRLYVSALGGGDKNLQWFFPHCDYYDAGMREAVKYVADRAEPNAELSTEIDWVAKYYAERFGRKDLTHTLPRKGRACKGDGPCYVAVQSGRWYFLNQEAVGWLSKREPWYVERIRDADVVKVYRLTPEDRPFEDNAESSAAVTP